ncbi:MAG: peptide chain release factor N(5)-glutamine methyltransferase [Chloroflexota bacterium]|nr:peptide chain release factor N(5)-glutamine methyltransferase [Chloroflexota bacterium]
MQPDLTTVQDILLDATRALGAVMEFHEARLQAELLLAHALETTRALLLARLSETVAPDAAARYAANVARRAQHEPLAYITGHQEFYGLDLLVDCRVLIPRHETETLVVLALQRIQRVPHAAPVIVDVGTGSGALVLALARHLPHARIYATDVSPDALAVARINAARLRLESRVVFLQGDLLAPVTEAFDLLVSNLPYIPSARFDQLPREIRGFEPRVALDGGADGLAVMRRLVAQIETHAARGAVGFLEISEEQGKAAVELFQRQFPRATVVLHQDLEGMDRAVEIRIQETERVQADFGLLDGDGIPSDCC